MAKSKTIFICNSCGTQSSKWQGKCSSCGEWNTIQEERIHSLPSRPSSQPNSQNHQAFYQTKPVKIEEIKFGAFAREVLTDAEFNRVLGGGIVPGSVILISGQPGIGKSTLCLQLALSIKNKVLYVSGEESEEQIKLRAERISKPSGSCYILAATEISHILEQAHILQPQVIIIDSIQTMYIDQLDSSAGTVTQIRESTAEFQRYAKQNKIAIFIIGHITKDGEIAGPKLLEHLVDTVLYFEGDRNHAYRLLRSRKNRFGSADEIGVYEMTEFGLRPVQNPSDVLINKDKINYSGSAIGVIGEGSRKFLIEVQALVTRAVYGTPQRSSTGYDSKRMNMLLAVLEKKCNLPLGFNDVFLNIAGGIKVYDPAIDLALIAAIFSSLENKTLDESICFIGEIGLSGEIRPVQKVDQRLQEAERFGIKSAVISKHNKINSIYKNIQVIPLQNIQELIELIG